MIQTTKYPYIAFLAGIFTVLGFSHLIYNVYLTKKTEHFTFLWIFFLITSHSLLLIYGLLNNIIGLIIPPVFLIFGIIYIIYVKINYEMNTKIEDDLRSKNIL